MSGLYNSSAANAFRTRNRRRVFSFCVCCPVDTDVYYYYYYYYYYLFRRYYITRPDELIDTTKSIETRKTYTRLSIHTRYLARLEKRDVYARFFWCVAARNLPVDLLPPPLPTEYRTVFFLFLLFFFFFTFCRASLPESFAFFDGFCVLFHTTPLSFCTYTHYTHVNVTRIRANVVGSGGIIPGRFYYGPPTWQRGHVCDARLCRVYMCVCVCARLCVHKHDRNNIKNNPYRRRTPNLEDKFEYV